MRREPERMTPAWPAAPSCFSRLRRMSERGVSDPDIGLKFFHDRRAGKCVVMMKLEGEEDM